MHAVLSRGAIPWLGYNTCDVETHPEEKKRKAVSRHPGWRLEDYFLVEFEKMLTWSGTSSDKVRGT